jgi:hypothetical protein
MQKGKNNHKGDNNQGSSNLGGCQDIGKITHTLKTVG